MNTTYYKDMSSSSLAAQDVHLTFVSRAGVQEVSLQHVNKSRLYLGRDAATNDFVFQSRTISGKHAKFKIEERGVFFADLNSTNGTYYMKSGRYVKMDPNRYFGPLKDGMMFQIGGCQHDNQVVEDNILMIVSSASNPDEYKKFPLFDEDYIVGRSPSCDIVLTQPSVSSQHARFFKQGMDYYVEDLDSTNGVFVNGKKIGHQQRLVEKDMIQIGGNMLIFSSNILFCKTSTDGIQLTMCDLVKKVNGGKKMILSHVSCTIDKNEFVAIVGGSGAGKSTLLKTLGGYDKFYEGDVFYNGISLKQHYNELKNIIGYVPQEDIVFENLTLKRMLYYTAKLKLPDNMTKSEIDARIQEVLKLVELSEHQNTMIRSLSGGQKKRASIAVELLADPGMFFLDEPTSGLDPGTEQKLMRVLNRLSKTQGKTIVMVTHTTQSLELCDKIIFMGKNGTLSFIGTPDEAKMFFDTDNFVDIYNLLEENTPMWAKQFEAFNDHFELEPYNPKAVSKPKRKSFTKQLITLTRRYGELVRNDLPRLGLLMIQPVLIAILIWIVAGDDVFDKYQPTKQILFTFSCSGIWIGIFNTIQEVCKERAILKREYMSNLRLTTYIMSKYLVQLWISLAQTAIFTGLFTVLLGTATDKGVILPYFAEMFITMWLTIYASSALGLLVSSVMKNGDRAMAVSPFLLIIQLLFSGILFELKGASNAISYVTVSRWSVEALGTVVGMEKLPSVNPLVAVNDGAMFEHTATHLLQTWGILAAFVLILAIVSIICLRNVSKDR